jgi:hypothetical protein
VDAHRALDANFSFIFAVSASLPGGADFSGPVIAESGLQHYRDSAQTVFFCEPSYLTAEVQVARGNRPTMRCSEPGHRIQL